MKKYLALAVVSVILIISSGPKVHAVSGIVFPYDSNAPVTELNESETYGPSSDKYIGILAEFDSHPPTSTDFDFTVTTDGQCLVTFYSKAGDTSPQTSISFNDRTDTTQNPYDTNIRGIAVYPVDDTKYEGKHSCKLTATAKSSSDNGAAINVSGTHSISINDNDPAPAPVAAKPKSAPAPVANVVEPPAAPTTSGIKVADEAIVAGTPVKTDLTKPLVLSGKTVPKGIVKLFIFSEPKEATVTADDNGNWTYEVTDLPPGDHHIEAEVTDPATGKTSARNTAVLAFTVTEKPKLAAAIQETVAAPVKAKSATPLFIGLGVLAVIGLAVGGYFMKRRMSAKKSDVTVGEPIAPTIDEVVTPEATERANPPETPQKPAV